MQNKFKVKKGSVVLYVLALMLVTAGYWNYISRETLTIAAINNENENTTSDEHLGDATLVSNNQLIQEENGQNIDVEKNTEAEDVKDVAAVTEDGYFQESKLARDKMYSETLETYQGILNNTNVSEEQKSIVTQEITKLNKEKNAIMICENLISTKGFSNCVIFVNVDSISVIVQSQEELKTEEIAQIQNVISREMCAEVENIHIMKK